MYDFYEISLAIDDINQFCQRMVLFTIFDGI